MKIKQIDTYTAFFFLFIAIISCTRNSDKLLPKAINVKQSSVVGGSNYYLTIYELGNKGISQTELNIYPLEVYDECTKCSVLKWTKFEEIDSSEQNRLLGIIEEYAQLNDEEEILNLSSLIGKPDRQVYFSGFYRTMFGRENTRFNFYEYMHFLDITGKRLYVIDNID